MVLPARMAPTPRKLAPLASFEVGGRTGGNDGPTRQLWGLWQGARRERVFGAYSTLAIAFIPVRHACSLGRHADRRRSRWPARERARCHHYRDSRRTQKPI